MPISLPFLYRNSLRLRLAATLFLGFIVLLGAASILVYFVARNLLEEDFDARLFAKAQAATASISQKGTALDVDWDELPQDLNPRKHAQDAIQLFDASGHAFFKDSPSFTYSLSDVISMVSYRDEVLPKLGNFRVLILSFVPRVEEEDVSVTPPGLRKACLLIIATTRASLDHSLRKLAVILILTTSGTSLLGLLLVWAVLRQGLRPLDDLAAAVAGIKAESLGQTIMLNDLPEELSPIIGKLNNLLDRLDVSFARERRFSADVSHELRTPVAELKTLSEVMLQEAEHPPEIQQAFRDSRDIAIQMESLVTVLLEMVRQEENVASLPLSEIDLELQIRSTWSKHEEKANSRKIQLQVVAPDKTIWVSTEQRFLSMVLSNLFDNAIEYSPEGSSIVVEFHEDAEFPCFAISNPAPNLTQADLSHLFERFWRKDKARGNSSHFGLGLSLTHTLCQRLGIQLTVSMKDANLIRFCLCFSSPEKSPSNK